MSKLTETEVLRSIIKTGKDLIRTDIKETGIEIKEILGTATLKLQIARLEIKISIMEMKVNSDMAKIKKMIAEHTGE